MVFLDDVLGTRVPILVALDTAAGIARAVERMNVTLLPRSAVPIVPPA